MDVSMYLFTFVWLTVDCNECWTWAFKNERWIWIWM